MSISPSVTYIRLAGTSVAKPVSVRVSGAWVAVQAVPGAPTGVTGTPGDTSVAVSWTAPTNTGGIPITAYTVTSSPGSFTATASTTSATVTGLTDGTPYTFTVTATNAVGTGAASTASSSVTPIAITGQLYITPATGSYSNSGSISLVVHANTYATSTTSIQVSLDYDATKLQYNSPSSAAVGPYTILYDNSTSGNVLLGLGAFTNQTGDEPIVTVPFTAIGTGTTPVTVDAASYIYNASAQNILNSRIGGSYTIS